MMLKLPVHPGLMQFTRGDEVHQESRPQGDMTSTVIPVSYCDDTHREFFQKKMFQFRFD